MNCNKAIGTAFEKEVADILSKHGYYVHMLKGSQTFDLIAGKENQIYGFECKTCDTGKFNVNRIEVNQMYGFKTFIRDCSNSNAYFIFKYEDIAYISQADYILSLPTVDGKQIQVDKFTRLEEWLSENNSK